MVFDSAKPVCATLREGGVLLCIGGFVLLGVAGHVLNESVYAHVSSYCGIAREIATLASALAFLGLFAVASRAPHLLDRRLVTVAAVGCSLTSVLVLEFALTLHVVWATVVGLVFLSFSSAWAFTLLLCALLGLGDPRRVLVSVAVGMALGEAANAVQPPLAPNAGTAEIFLCQLIVLAAFYRPASVLDAIAQGEAPVDLEMSNPESFLNPGHGLFLCVLLFSIATGYGLTLGEVGGAPARVDSAALVVIAAAAWVLLSRSSDREDTLFSFAMLVVVAGFIVAPFTFLTGLTSANALILIGVRCFSMLVWLVVLAVGLRNPLALLPTFALVRCMMALGTDVGAIAGHTTNDLLGTDGGAAALIAEGVLFLFIALLWVGFRKFSFAEAIRGVAEMGPSSRLRTADGPVASPEDAASAPAGERLAAAEAGGATDSADGPAEGEVPETPTIEERCRAIGRERGLTERETEIFAMLARGRNGRYLMDYYVVSRNTVKSHIKHIYAKLHVHSQQELIDLVERGK